MLILMGKKKKKNKIWERNERAVNLNKLTWGNITKKEKLANGLIIRY